MPNKKGMSKAGKKILSAMENALKYAKGDKSLGVSYSVRPITARQIVVDIPDLLQTIRDSLNMNRSQFAEAFYFTKYSIRNWEMGDREPPEYCTAYLLLISKDPWKAYRDLHPET